MWKEAGVSYDGFPGLSKTTPFACLREVGWYPKVTNSARRSRRRLGFTEFTFFQTEYGTPSGPGAEEGEDLASAAAISSLVSGRAEGVVVEAAPRWELRFWGEKVIQESFVDFKLGVGPREFGETQGLAGRDESFRRPDIVACCFCQEIGPVGIFGLLYRLEVALSRGTGDTHVCFPAVLLGQPAGFCILLT